jgi:hypothetical protein
VIEKRVLQVLGFFCCHCCYPSFFRNLIARPSRIRILEDRDAYIRKTEAAMGGACRRSANQFTDVKPLHNASTFALCR